MTRSPGRGTIVAIALGGCLALAGCGAADAPSDAGDTSERDTIVQPTDGSDPAETTNAQTPSAAPAPQPTSGAGTDPGAPQDSAPVQPPTGSGGVVDLALQDLANRLGVGIDQITVTRNDDVTWRDGSLGCATKGMAYITMLVAGHLVVLEADGTTYEYHAAKGRAPFLCEDPQPPLPVGG